MVYFVCHTVFPTDRFVKGSYSGAVLYTDCTVHNNPCRICRGHVCARKRNSVLSFRPSKTLVTRGLRQHICERKGVSLNSNATLSMARYSTVPTIPSRQCVGRLFARCGCRELATVFDVSWNIVALGIFSSILSAECTADVR